MVEWVQTQSPLTGDNVSLNLRTDINNVEIVNATGSGVDTLIGTDAINIWTLGATNTLNDGATTITFSGFESITGGNLADTFNVVGVSNITEIDGGVGDDNVTLDEVGLIDTFDGNVGTDSLTIINGNSIWTIDPDLTDLLNPMDIGNGSVAVEGMPATMTNFNSVESRTGSSLGTNTVDLSNFGAATILLADFQDFDTVVGSGSGVLRGVNDQQNIWTIDGVDSGSVSAAGIITDFMNFASLQGGNSVDTFNITETGSITGEINGGAGNNSLRRSNAIGDNIWLLTGPHRGTVTYDGISTNFSNIQTLVGSSNAGVADTLIGLSNLNNQWTIDSNGAGNVAQDTVNNVTDTTHFMNMENLVGGNLDDVFNITANINSIDLGNGNNQVNVMANGSVIGDITGGNGVDTIVISGVAATVVSITTGAGNDMITVADGGVVTGNLMSGSGNDSITIVNEIRLA